MFKQKIIDSAQMGNVSDIKINPADNYGRWNDDNSGKLYPQHYYEYLQNITKEEKLNLVFTAKDNPNGEKFALHPDNDIEKINAYIKEKAPKGALFYVSKKDMDVAVPAIHAGLQKELRDAVRNFDISAIRGSLNDFLYESIDPQYPQALTGLLEPIELLVQSFRGNPAKLLEIIKGSPRDNTLATNILDTTLCTMAFLMFCRVQDKAAASSLTALLANAGA
ncbi:MAG: hypothetical protein ABIH39_08480, partial [Candidatus Margulisiibacteriota bacterium]